MTEGEQHGRDWEKASLEYRAEILVNPIICRLKREVVRKAENQLPLVSLSSFVVLGVCLCSLSFSLV